MAIPPDETRGPQILAISWTTLTLATVTIALRAHMRRKAHATGWDDYFMFLALLITVFGSICTSMQVHYGFGRHIHNVPLKELSLLIEWTTIAIIVNYIGIFCVKISVSLFVLRVIKGTHRRIRLLLYCFMVILALSTLAGIVTTSTQCIPLKKSWTQELPGKCVSRSVFDLTFSVFGAISAATDMFCAIIPAFIIGGLQMDKGRKKALIVVLTLGLIPAACAIGKIASPNFHSTAGTVDQVTPEMWAM